jgi:hypothetical protein
MKQTSAAIVCLAAAILAAGAVTAYSVGNVTAGMMLAGFAAAAGLIGVLSLIRACLRDHDLAIDVTGRIEFLEELVYLERLSLERKDRLRQRLGGPASSTEPVSYSYDAQKRRSAA